MSECVMAMGCICLHSLVVENVSTSPDLPDAVLISFALSSIFSRSLSPRFLLLLLGQQTMVHAGSRPNPIHKTRTHLNHLPTLFSYR
jgi:hypothetical protein